MKRILIFVATYNEVDNIELLIQEILRNVPGTEILVLDDASPDGTGEVVRHLASSNPNIHVIQRPYKLGLGTAHKLAMKYAVTNGFDRLVTMDADFSHHPKYLPELLNQLSQHDFVIGSRYMAGGKCEYGFLRTLVSRTANMLSRGLLRIPLHECTTSYRGFQVSLLKRFNIDIIRSDGYSFFIESLWYIYLLTSDINEFPIYFEDRRAGSSKISKFEIIKAFLILLNLCYKKLFFIKSVKEHVCRSDMISHEICPNCKNQFFTEIYPSTSQTLLKEGSAYQCTSYGHKSHGRIIQCLQCGLVYTENQMTPETFNRLYASVEDPVYVANIAARYKTFQYNLSQIHSYLPPKGRLLDIGTYCGAFLKVAQDFGFEAMGLEPSNWAVKYSKNVLKQQVIQGTIHDLPDEFENFDVITLWDVLEHLPDPFSELSVIHSKLKPQGVLVFSTLNIDNWFPQIMGERWPWFMDMHLYYFNQHIIEQILSQAGFQLIHVQSYCHIITIDYFLSKLESLGVWGIKHLTYFLTLTPFKQWLIPFRFGDIQLFIAKKYQNSKTQNNSSYIRC